MNAAHAYETTLWNSIPYDIRRSISDSASHGGFETSYYILIGTPLWSDRENIRNILTKLGYETELKEQAGDGKGNIIEYILKIYWDHPRKLTYWN
jgi:hypothetical protein